MHNRKRDDKPNKFWNPRQHLSHVRQRSGEQQKFATSTRAHSSHVNIKNYDINKMCNIASRDEIRWGSKLQEAEPI